MVRWPHLSCNVCVSLRYKSIIYSISKMKTISIYCSLSACYVLLCFLCLKMVSKYLRVGKKVKYPWQKTVKSYIKKKQNGKNC